MNAREMRAKARDETRAEPVQVIEIVETAIEIVSNLSETFEFQFDINSSTETRDSYYRVIKRRDKDHDLTLDSYDRVIERRDRDENRFETSTDNSLENVQRTKKRRKKKKKTFF